MARTSRLYGYKLWDKKPDLKVRTTNDGSVLVVHPRNVCFTLL